MMVCGKIHIKGMYSRRVLVFLILFWITMAAILVLGIGNTSFDLATNLNLEEPVYSLDQLDPAVADYIRNHHLTKPSQAPYNLTEAGSSLNGYSRLVNAMFKHKLYFNIPAQIINAKSYILASKFQKLYFSDQEKYKASQIYSQLANLQKDGTFIEVGAYDGEAASNSLFFEKIGWTGLLIECNPLLLPKLRAKNRKAWIADVCLSTSDTPEIMKFSTPVDWPASAKLGQALNEDEMKHYGIDWMANKTWLDYKLPSFPLYSIIKATESFKHIDFLSLDVEGAEIEVLRHFPFHRLKVNVIIAEIHTFSKAERAGLVRFMSTKGYVMAHNMGTDYVFLLQDKEAFK